MELTNQGLEDQSAWKRAGYELPLFCREQVIKRTKEKPFWIHFGAGNIFRAFQSDIVQQLLNNGKIEQGLIVAEGYDYEIVNKLYHPHNDLGIKVTLCADGTIKKSVQGSVTESLVADSSHTDFERLREIFSNQTLQIVSFTITEKGYHIRNYSGEFEESVVADFKSGPDHPISYMGKISALLYKRFVSGKYPIALVSMDNCSQNGTKLYNAVIEFAKAWENEGLLEKGFVDYISDSDFVSFPWTMIDKITPRPDTRIFQQLEADRIKGLDPVITSKNTYCAPFVNTEECQYLVIEDIFPNGRPDLEGSGVFFTDRQTVERVERMKVCTCLNPLHTALAIFGCLLSYHTIHSEMENVVLRKLVERIGKEEGLAVVTDPGILSPEKFLDEVLRIRLPNPFMADTPQRIATDTSQKLSVRYGETIKAYQRSTSLSMSALKMIPLVLAGWCRYLVGLDDNGQVLERSADPMLDTLNPYFTGLKLGESFTPDNRLVPILSDAKIFGVDLYKAGLGKLVEQYFNEMLAGSGAVKNVLEKYVME